MICLNHFVDYPRSDSRNTASPSDTGCYYLSDCADSDEEYFVLAPDETKIRGAVIDCLPY